MAYTIKLISSIYTKMVSYSFIILYIFIDFCKMYFYIFIETAKYIVTMLNDINSKAAAALSSFSGDPRKVMKAYINKLLN